LRDVGVLVSIKDGSSCPQMMRVQFGSSASKFAGEEMMRCMHYMCSRDDDWRVMHVLEVPTALASSRVAHISFPETAEPRVYAVVARVWSDCDDECERRPPVFTDFALRCLDASLASGGLSVADAEESRGERLRLCLRWLQIFHEDKRFAARSVSSKCSVFESEHPYPNNADVKHTISFPGAERIEITFDERCRTESGCDFLQFYDISAQKTTIGRSNSGRSADRHWPGVNGVPALIHRGSQLLAHFRSDGSVNDWGYLFTATAFFPEYSATGKRSYPNANTLLRSAFEFLVADLCFMNGELALPKGFAMQAYEGKYISQCFLRQVHLRRLQRGLSLSVERITSAFFDSLGGSASLQEVSQLITALSLILPNYFIIHKASKSTVQSPENLRAFKVGDSVCLKKSHNHSRFFGKPVSIGANKAKEKGNADSCGASSSGQPKISGIVLQVKATRCLVKGLTPWGKPYNFKHEALELARDSHGCDSGDDMHTVTAVDSSYDSLLLELQCTILHQIWQFVSPRQGHEQCTNDLSLQEQCTNDSRLVSDFAKCFEACSCMRYIGISVGHALFFLRALSHLGTFFVRMSCDWRDSASLITLNSLRTSLRDIKALLPRALDMFAEGVLPRAIAALLFFIIRGNSKDASSGAVRCLQLSASILNILQDYLQSLWPVAIEYLYSNPFTRQDPLADLALLSACKEFEGAASDKNTRVYESEHPYIRGKPRQHDISFPGV
jgi:hypothetical protein